MATLEEARRELLPIFKEDMERIKKGEPICNYREPYLNELLARYRGGMSERQTIICFTKWMHNFNITDMPSDLKLLRGEVDEAQEALDAGSMTDFVKELADIAIYCYGIANMAGWDLDTIIERKMQYNIERNYTVKE